jgi:hypothetical protein
MSYSKSALDEGRENIRDTCNHKQSRVVRAEWVTATGFHVYVGIVCDEDWGCELYLHLLPGSRAEFREHSVGSNFSTANAIFDATAEEQQHLAACLKAGTYVDPPVITNQIVNSYDLY